MLEHVVQSENEIVQSVLVIVLWLSGMISYKTKQKEENLKNAQKGNNQKTRTKKIKAKNVEKPTKRCKTLENPIKKGKISVKDLKNQKL